MQGNQQLHRLIRLGLLGVCLMVGAYAFASEVPTDADTQVQPAQATATRATVTPGIQATATRATITPDVQATATRATVTPGDDNDDNDNTPNPSVTATQITVTPDATTETTTPTVTVIPGEDDDDDPIIVIVGPVQAISINIITVYNFDIQMTPTDPALQVIQLGDVVRVVGEWEGGGDRFDDNDDDDDNNDRFFDTQVPIQITAITIVFINVDVVIVDGLVWRDPGDCSGVPDWITADDATEYFVRCVGRPGGGPSVGNPGGGNPGGGNPGGNPGRGGGGGDNDDDDD